MILSESAIVAIMVALLGSQFLPSLVNKIKPKSELDAFNIDRTMKLYEKLEKSYDKLDSRYAELEQDFDELQEKYEKLLAKDEELQKKYKNLKTRFDNLTQKTEGEI